MKRPSKLRVLLAVNWWRIRHKRTPILYLPKATTSRETPFLPKTCPLKYALGVESVGVRHAGRGTWQAVANEDGREVALSRTLSRFVNAFDLEEDSYPELRSS